MLFLIKRCTEDLTGVCPETSKLGVNLQPHPSNCQLSEVKKYRKDMLFEHITSSVTDWLVDRDKRGYSAKDNHQACYLVTFIIVI